MAERAYGLKVADPAFADCNSTFDESRYIFYGAPFDATVSHLSGTSAGPAAIRRETYNFETFLMDLEVELEEVPMHDAGDLILRNTLEGQADMLASVYKLQRYILEKERFPILMGGEHSVSEGSVDAFMDVYGPKGGIAIVVDAHLDFRSQYMDNPHSHACFSRRVFEKWGKDSICIVGARSGCREEFIEARNLGLRYFTSQHVYSRGILEVIDAWDTALSLRERPIYLSIDIDGIDPSSAPGTGTPEPWGLTTWDVLRLMEELKGNIKAIDVMEVSPNIEKYITPGLAGKLLREMVGLKEMTARHPTWLEKV